MSQQVNPMRKEPKAVRQLKKHEQTLKAKDWYPAQAVALGMVGAERRQ
jgi:hypothetical protein